MSNLQRLKLNPVKEIFRWIRMFLLAGLAFLFYQHLMSFEDFEGWIIALKFDLFKAVVGVVGLYLADRFLAHGPRAHNLTDWQVQARNAIRIIGAAIVIGMSLSGA